jgi:hypothetical protein
VLLLTDRLPDERLPDWVETQSVGEPLDNDAITFASRTDEGEKTRVVLRVSHFGSRPAEVRVKLHADSSTGGKPFEQERLLALRPGEGHLFQATLENVGALRVTLPSDALDEDGEVVLHPVESRLLGIGLDEGLSAAERGALLRFVRTQPDVFLDASSPAVRFGPPGSGARVVLGARGVSHAFLGPFYSEKSDPLLEDVDLSGVVWTAGDNPPGRPLVTVGAHVLVSREAAGTVHLNLDMARSNLARSSAWPILLSNITRDGWARLPGFHERHLFLGQEAQVTVPPEGKWVLEGPALRPIALPVGQLTLTSLAEPGEYTLTRDGKAASQTQVLSVDAAESDLRQLRAGKEMAQAPDSPRQENKTPRAIWPLAAMLGLLLVDYRLTRERR